MTTDTSTTSAGAATQDGSSARFRIAAAGIALVASALLMLQSDAPVSAVADIATGYGVGISLIVLILILGQFIWVGFSQKPVQGGDGSTAWYRAFAARVQWGDVVVSLLALTVTVSSFTVYKSTVVGSQGYGYDAMFIAWDRALFAGKDPWVLSHAILSSPYATKVIDILYHPAFLPMVLGYIVCVAARAHRALRYTYMASYLASFVIIGMIAASALSSAGPIYDGVLFGDGTTFEPLIARLASQNEAAGPLSAVFAQDYLLALNARGLTGLGGGISAMPSMHIALAFLWVFPAWHLSRVLGVIITIYAMIIWLGSVHLGWHYFVDGLVGVLMLGVIWYIAGRSFGLYGRAQVIRATT